MSEMIERVMAAIGQFNLDDMSPGYTDDLARAARAAIEAMREPTAAMLAAAQDSANQSYIQDGSWAWEIMIDAALKEHQ